MPLKTILRSSQWFAVLAAILVIMVTPATAQGNMHIVQRGENLFRIALRYGVSVDAMVQANGLSNPNQIYAGQALVIPDGTSQTAAPAPSASPAATAPVYHTVQRGETLASIARYYGVDWQELARANNIANPNRILVGQRLTIMTSGAPQSATAPPPAASAPAPADPLVTNAPNPAQARTHIVQPGEHLSGIAQRYGVSWTTIARANGIVDPNRLLVGQALTIPAADITPNTPTYLQPTTGQPVGPAPTVTNGKQIIVDLSEQRAYAYQDGQLMRSVIVSTGLPNTPTVLGDYNIYWKLTSQTMQGPGYYLPGVPWVMYFYQGYAIHGTYWHNNFGRPMSHGCVNLTIPDSQWFFEFAEVGTPVRVVP